MLLSEWQLRYQTINTVHGVWGQWNITQSVFGWSNFNYWDSIKLTMYKQSQAIPGSSSHRTVWESHPHQPGYKNGKVNVAQLTTLPVYRLSDTQCWIRIRALILVSTKYLVLYMRSGEQGNGITVLKSGSELWYQNINSTHEALGTIEWHIHSANFSMRSPISGY